MTNGMRLREVRLCEKSRSSGPGVSYALQTHRALSYQEILPVFFKDRGIKAEVRLSDLNCS